MTEQAAANEKEVWGNGSNGWRPEAGDQLTGKLTDITTGESEYGRYPIVTITTDTGDEVAVHGFHHSLKNRLREMRPALGDTLTIKYLGMVDQLDRDGNVRTVNGVTKTLAQYNVDSPEFVFDWDRI